MQGIYYIDLIFSNYYTVIYKLIIHATGTDTTLLKWNRCLTCHHPKCSRELRSILRTRTPRTMI